MQNSPHRFTHSEPALGVADLERYIEGWLLSGEINQHSACTLANCRDITSKLLWFLHYKELKSCSTQELHQFLAYLTHGHKEPSRRWDNPQMSRPVGPRTVHTYRVK